ncbi:MAG: carboxypeptidase regulatory-like domain-containing protein [Blastocatellia bacterium]|nr:carboxypeptidase regulatory-like domain-containing protein [Blastocatellia bacterium]
MKTNFKFVISMLTLVALFAVSAFAQRTTGDIEGTVTDPQGAVVPNVTVTVSATTGGGAGTITSGFKRTVQANAQGFFRVQQVPPGSYTITTEPISGFGAANVPNVRVVVDNTTPVTIQLAVGGAAVNVNVSADDAPPIDAAASKIQANITSQRIELLPKGVDFTSVLKTVPGTRPEGNSGGITVDGASGSENAFYIDGQEVTNFRTGTLNGNNAIPTQFVQEVQVKSSGFEAEFGGATGGVISVVTKGGSNDWRGEFGMQFNTPKLNGNPRDSLVRFTASGYSNTTEYVKIPKSEGTNVFPTANLSGPIVKDKLWFFGSYTPQIFETINNTTYYTNLPASVRTVTNTQRYRTKRTYEYAFMRLDASPTNNLRLTGTYTWNPIIDKGALGAGTVSLGGALPFATFGSTTLTGNQLTDVQGGRQNSNNITAQAVWTPTSKLVISGRFSRGFLNERLAAYMVPRQTRFRCQVGVVSLIGCSSGQADAVNSQINKDVSIRTNYEVDASYLVSNFGGRHEFKGGYQRFKILNDVDRGYIDYGIVDIYVAAPGAGATGYRDMWSIEDLGAPVTPTCVGGTCVRDSLGYITNPAYIGAGEMIRFGTKGKGQNLNQSLYIQDRWQPTSRLTLNLGLRMEKEDLPSFNGLAPPINFGFGDKISPRLGFAYDLMGDGKTKVFAFFGRFFDRLKFELPRGSFGGDFYRVDFFEIFANQGDWRSYTYNRIRGNFNDAPGGACPTTGFIGSGIARCQFDYRIASNSPIADIYTGAVDPNLKPFRQTEFTAGMEHQLSRDFVLKGRYTFKNVDKAIEDAGIINAQGSEAYIIGNPGSGLHAELLQQLGYQKSTTPKRRYDAVEVQLDKRLSNNYYFNVNYTYSRLHGNYSGLASSDEAGRTSPGVNRFFDLPFIGFTAAGNKDNGPLATDRPHIVNAYGSYIFDWNGSKSNSTEFSAFQTFQSGTPVTSTIAFITTTIFTERGDLGRTPMFTQTDFSVSHKYRFGRDNRFTLVGDLNILNLLDEDNVTGYYTQKTTSTLQPYTSALFGSQFLNADGSVNYVGAINAYNAGTLLNQFNSYFAAASSRVDGRYGQPNSFQGPRSVRFGFRLLF